MAEQDRVSQASSLVTISAFPVRCKDKESKVHNFGKRTRALKRDPNCPVVIRGWLYKQDSSGLKLWKRRWFVLSDFCLFYYKDSREEAVLGSIPLPSYRILFCTPRECKNRKYAFKAVHQGMRSYFFSADTQEDMLGWVRALSQSACMDTEGSLNRRCSSFQDFTQLGGSSESLTFFHMSSPKNGPTQPTMYGNGPQSESCNLQKATAGTTDTLYEGKQAFSPLPRTSTPTSYSGPRRRGQSLSLEGNEQDSHHFISRIQTPPPILKSTGSRPLTPKCPLGTRPHTPVGRVDIRPNDDHLLPPQNMGYSPPSAQRATSLSSVTPTTEKRLLKPPPHFSPQPHVPVMRRGPGKACSHGGHAGSLPPLPPPRIAPAAPPPHHHHHHHHHRSPMSACLLQHAMPSPADFYQDRDPFRPVELDVDAILTRICGCDKLLQALSKELVQLQADKDNVQCALEMTRLQLDDHLAQGLGVQGKDGLSQKGFLQEELVTVRARLCDISVEMEKVWSQYERMESELSVVRSHLQHICRFGKPQEQSQAQRELWMTEDILCGLRANRNHFRAILASQRQHTVLQKGALHHEGPRPQVDRSPSGIPMLDMEMEVELEPPPRPPLPQEVQETGLRPGWLERQAEVEVFSSDLSSCHRSLDRTGNSLTVLPREKKQADIMPATLPGFTSSSWATSDTAAKRARMSEEEQRERIRKNQERLSNQKKEALPTGINHIQYQRSSPPREEPPLPIRVTRVYTAVLPSTLIARRVSVEDPPSELVNPFPQQISTGTPFSELDQNQKSLLQETVNQNSPWLKPDRADDQSYQRLPSDLSSEIFEDRPGMSHTAKGLSKQKKQKLAKEEDSQLHSHNHSSIPSSQSPEAAEQHLKDVAKLEAEKVLWSQTNDWTASECGILPSDDGAKLEDGGPGLARVTLGNGRREKPGIRASLLAADPGLDLRLTPEQREAKLKRVERIRERVIKSAAKESIMHPLSPPLRGNREHIVNLSLKLANKASKKSKGMAACSEVSDECQVTENLDCGGGCYSDGNPELGLRVTTKPKPSRIPSITGNKGRHSLKGTGGLKDAANTLGKTPINNHSKSLDVTCHARNVSPNQLNTTNNITALLVYPKNMDQQSVQKEDNSYPFHNNENEEEGNSVSQKSQFNSRRTEWFLSDNHKVEYIPLVNQFKEPNSGDNTTDQGNTYSHLMWQPAMMTSNKIKCLQFSSKQKVSEVDISVVSPDSTGKMEQRSKDPTTHHVPAHQSLVHHAQSSTADNLIYEIKNSDESAAMILEGTTSEKKKNDIFEQSNKIPELSQSLANGEKQNIQSNEKQGYSFTDEGNCNELLANQTIPTYATIHFIPAPLLDTNQDKENNTFLTLHSESEDSHSDPRNTSVDQMTSSLTKSVKDLHIYEEISFNSTPSESQLNNSHNTILTDNEFTSSSYLQSSRSEILPNNLSAHSISTNQRGEKEIEKENTDSDWPDENKSPSEGQTNLEATKSSNSEVSREAPLGKDMVSYSSEVNDKKDDQGSEFVRARVTVVRTSL
ncbi:pleckstrin homology domain-containing family A member 4 isoform X3 [Paramormyrops kingsleyae]|nr:pleckstrin homology domain-containing family A member 7-like isoform X3 [Paramormyrops kingsleyae]